MSTSTLYRELKAFYIRLNLPDVLVKQVVSLNPRIYLNSFCRCSTRQFAKQCHSTGLLEQMTQRLKGLRDQSSVTVLEGHHAGGETRLHIGLRKARGRIARVPGRKGDQFFDFLFRAFFTDHCVSRVLVSVMFLTMQHEEQGGTSGSLDVTVSSLVRDLIYVCV